MKTKTLLPNLLRWCGGLALALGWLAPAVLAQGIATQTLTWTGAAGPALALNTPHPLGVTASSGLPVTLTVESGPATLVNGVLTITGPGRVRVTAEQPGDPTYAPVRESRHFNGKQVVLSPLGGYDFTGVPVAV
ncbi:MAG: hypothetical protein HS113_30765, partial [Verrucomicrobiales bacterium]|nr:hypothetical protein [Verrucomicrobiales bacterium]